MVRATASRADCIASLACWPGEWRLEGLPQNRSMASSMACCARELVLVVAALSAYIMACSISLKSVEKGLIFYVAQIIP